ncbi:MAG: tRNA (guanosine(46)-N7)-methyltransferase TrmB [Bacteroidota bacterium]
MAIGKLQRFAEMEHFSNVIQPSFEEVWQKDHVLKGKWAASCFKNKKPIVLELGCGKGEYTIGLAQRFKDKNFIGIDIKGARMFIGARQGLQEKIANAVFLRTRIELLRSFFGRDEISEIWITFPDPQLKKRRVKKRLTSSGLLNMYKQFLAPGGLVHLKTDNDTLYEYTLALARENRLEIRCSTGDLYNSGMDDDILSIQTFYEKQFLEQGMSINYLCFRLDNKEKIEEPEGEDYYIR